MLINEKKVLQQEKATVLCMVAYHLSFGPDCPSFWIVFLPLKYLWDLGQVT